VRKKTPVYLWFLLENPLEILKYIFFIETAIHYNLISILSLSSASLTTIYSRF